MQLDGLKILSVKIHSYSEMASLCKFMDESQFMY